ncbi:MAG TPA: T9SS type A sorting domain-containing protein, partial [Candidatus Cloacimonadota bacterium]|nr:T9SS type A sorting domain-containing protein [Candidatus Cloacimonadota bacterium]
KIVVLLLLIGVGMLFADLQIDIPFDQDIVGPSYATTGNYEYTTDWITMTNTSASAQTYTLTYTYENMPDSWGMSVCNQENCFMPNWPAAVPLEAGASELIHIVVYVYSTDGFSFNITMDSGDLTEPISLDFTFNTEDNTGNDEELLPTCTLQNYPNPFNPSTTIRFSVSQNEPVNLTIYNVKGQVVKTFTNLPATNSVVWNGLDDNNRTVDSGVYFYSLKTSGKNVTKKMILLK